MAQDRPLPKQLSKRALAAIAVEGVVLYAVDLVALGAVTVSVTCGKAVPGHGCLAAARPSLWAAVAIGAVFTLGGQLAGEFLLAACYGPKHTPERTFCTVGAAACGIAFAVWFHSEVIKLFSEGDSAAGLRLLRTLPVSVAGWFLALTAASMVGILIGMAIIGRAIEIVELCKSAKYRAAAPPTEPNPADPPPD